MSLASVIGVNGTTIEVDGGYDGRDYVRLRIVEGGPSSASLTVEEARRLSAALTEAADAAEREYLALRRVPPEGGAST